jgi:hypothetical protein
MFHKIDSRSTKKAKSEEKKSAGGGKSDVTAGRRKKRKTLHDDDDDDEEEEQEDCSANPKCLKPTGKEVSSMTSAFFMGYLNEASKIRSDDTNFCV